MQSSDFIDLRPFANQLYSDVYDILRQERHLLYVACTRARDHLLITGVDPASEFLDDLYR